MGADVINKVKVSNGTYLAAMVNGGSECNATVYNDKVTLYDMQWNKRGVINRERFEAHYRIVKEVMNKQDFYDIHHYVGGKVLARIQMRASYALCKHKVDELRRTFDNYRIGHLLIVPI